MKLEALIFDVDGTLAETEELHRQSFNSTFRTYGLDWTWDRDLYAELLLTTGSKERMAHYIEVYAQTDVAALDKLTDIHRAKTAAYHDLLTGSGLRLRPGIARLIREARDRGLQLSIATTTTPQNVTTLIESTLGAEALTWFTVSAGDVPGPKKPDPAVYVDALRKLAIDPGSAVAFEDSANGVKAARDAGIAVVVTPSFYLTREDFSGAAAVVSDLGEPDAPMQGLAGWRFPGPYVDVDGLEALLGRR